MAGKYSKKMDPKKKRIITISCIVLAVLLIILLGLYIGFNIYLNSRLSRFPSGGETYPMDPSDMTADATDTIPVVSQAESIITDGVVNILLVGQDRRAGEGRMHSDSMILVTINKKTKTLTMTSFMRDMWVYIPDRFNERINVPYMLGGFDLLNSTLDYNFGVSGDYNVEIDFAGFMSAVDVIGGVEIELTSAEASYLNRRGNWDVEENQGWQLKEGVNCLTGSQALAYSRIRAIGDDFGRTSRQRTVLNALLEKAKHMDLGTLYSLMDAIVPMLTTDMQDSEIIGYVMELAPLLPELKVVNQRIPADGTYSFARVDGMEVILPNFEKNWQLLQDTIGGE